MKTILLLCSLIIACSIAMGQHKIFTDTLPKPIEQPHLKNPLVITKTLPPSKVDFNAYQSLSKEVQQFRKKRLISTDTFNAYAKTPNTIILDTRSDAMYKRKHVKGAIHLNFSDFSQEALWQLIPDPNTRILIYCNNNFDNDPISFITKGVSPQPRFPKTRKITLALNIPTFINLYGYGYRNIYELADLVSVFNPIIQFEGTGVKVTAKQ